MPIPKTTLAIAGLLAVAAAVTWTTFTPAASRYVFAASWQPGFCETQPTKRECRNPSRQSFEASNFTLHGLWPQKQDYCDVPQDDIAADKSSRWSALPAVDLPTDLRQRLDQAMPGTLSNLERHEWIKHGTCSGQSPETFYSNALWVLDGLNASAVRTLFTDNIGKRITQDQIRAAFDQSFGPGAGLRVRVSCDRVSNRRLITELTIGLVGTIKPDASLADLIAASSPTDGGCDAGIVDPIGFQ